MYIIIMHACTYGTAGFNLQECTHVQLQALKACMYRNIFHMPACTHKIDDA